MKNRERIVEVSLAINLFTSTLICTYGKYYVEDAKFIFYYFWISLGFYIGFQLCKNEIKHLRKKLDEQHSSNK